MLRYPGHHSSKSSNPPSPSTNLVQNNGAETIQDLRLLLLGSTARLSSFSEEGSLSQERQNVEEKACQRQGLMKGSRCFQDATMGTIYVTFSILRDPQVLALSNAENGKILQMLVFTPRDCLCIIFKSQ